jgi:hypothetical protein
MDYGFPGMNNPLTVGGSLVLNGNLSLGDAAGGNLNLGGDWTQNSGANFYSNNRTVTFNGSSAQAIGGTAATTFAYLTVNNSNGVTLGQNVTVNHTLTFTSGKIATGVNKVIFVSTTIFNRTSGWIHGNLQKPVLGSSTRRTMPPSASPSAA